MQNAPVETAPPPPSPRPEPSRLKSVLGFVLNNFGPLVVFYAVDWQWGLFPAIAASTAWSIGDVIRHVVLKKPVTAIFKLTAGMTLVFGAVDLFAQQSLLFKYEASVTNVGMAVFFAATLRGKGSMIQETYASIPENAGEPMPIWLMGMFRWLTMLWSGYFVLKAVLYFFIARAYSIEQAMAIRVVVGNVSMGVMAGITFLFVRVYEHFAEKKETSAAGPKAEAAP